MRIVLYIVWALFVAVVTFSLIHSLRKTRRQEQLIASWLKVQATVTGNIAGWTHGGGGSTRSRRFYPTYQFADPNGILYESKMVLGCLVPFFALFSLLLFWVVGVFPLG